MIKKIFSIFSNYTRVKIMACLLEEDKDVSSLIKKCGISQSAVSQHLKKLKDLGIVICHSDGRNKVYELKNKEIGNISEEILRLSKK